MLNHPENINYLPQIKIHHGNEWNLISRKNTELCIMKYNYTATTKNHEMVIDECNRKKNYTCQYALSIYPSLFILVHKHESVDSQNKVATQMITLIWNFQFLVTMNSWLLMTWNQSQHVCGFLFNHILQT